MDPIFSHAIRRDRPTSRPHGFRARRDGEFRPEGAPFAQNAHVRRRTPGYLSPHYCRRINGRTRWEDLSPPSALFRYLLLCFVTSGLP